MIINTEQVKEDNIGSERQDEAEGEVGGNKYDNIFSKMKSREKKKS